MDYNPVYGDYVVHEVTNTGGGVSEPFGSMRRAARDFCSVVSFAARTIDAISTGSRVVVR